MARSWKTLAAGVALAALAGVFALEIWGAAAGAAWGRAALPANFGNFERVRVLLAKDDVPGEFTFVVTGDTPAGEPFERVSATLKDRPPAFVALLGNAVRRPNSVQHDFLASEMSEDPLPCPVFYVAGNHDTRPDSFPLKRFEERYGPSVFSFGYRFSLFIVLRVDGNDWQQGLDFLASELRKKRGDYSRVFVLMHSPVLDGSTLPPEAARRFADLFEGGRVDCVYTCGRPGVPPARRGETEYRVVATAGHEPGKSGTFCHAVAVTVTADGIRETPFVVSADEDAGDYATLQVASKAASLFRRHRAAMLAVNVLFVLLGAGAVVSLAGAVRAGSRARPAPVRSARPEGILRSAGRRIDRLYAWRRLRGWTGARGEVVRFEGWPGNHAYSIRDGRLVPCFELFDRSVEVRRHYPARMESLLDIGCCRGYYVLQAAADLDCPRAVGVDPGEAFIAEANFAKERLGLGDSRVRFYAASFEQLAADPKSFGAPFETVLLLGTYHYLYWGSPGAGEGARSHDAILDRLASLTTGRLILSGRMEVRHLPRALRDRARSSPERRDYTLDSFCLAADRLFDLRILGRLGKHPLILLVRRPSAE